jgi:hypothetical protein
MAAVASGEILIETERLPMPDLVEAYRLRWDIADIAVGVGRFRRPHAGTPEDDKAWGFLANTIERLAADALREPPGPGGEPRARRPVPGRQQPS